MGGFEWEKNLKALVAGGLIIVLLGGFWLYSNYRHRRERLEHKINSAQSELTQFEDLLQKYHELTQQIQKMKQTSGAAASHNLITTVEDATEQISARSQLIYVRPQPDKTSGSLTEEGVEIRLEKLQLHQLVELLYQFDQARQLLRVSQLKIRTRFDNPEQLDAVMILSRFREKTNE